MSVISEGIEAAQEYVRLRAELDGERLPDVQPSEQSCMADAVLALHDCRENALALLVRFGQTDGAHHKAWVIDQVVRVLAGERYDELVRSACDGEDGPDTYDWDRGIAP